MYSYMYVYTYNIFLASSFDLFIVTLTYHSRFLHFMTKDYFKNINLIIIPWCLKHTPISSRVPEDQVLNP